MADSDYRSDIRVTGDRVVAVRAHQTSPLTSVPASGHYPLGAPIGQDGFAYIVGQSFTHDFIPYRSKRTGELTEGCERCGWSARIHSPYITHVACDRCQVEVPVGEHVEAKADDDYGIHTYFEGTDHQIRLRSVLRQTRFFCTDECRDAWFAEHGANYGDEK